MRSASRSGWRRPPCRVTAASRRFRSREALA
jgi:hypothetical protein